MTARLVVLASGSGTTLQALLDSPIRAGIVAVISDVPGCRALQRAHSSGIATACVDPAEYATRPAWDEALLAAVRAHEPSWVVAAGFMRILGPAFVHGYEYRIVNVHPSLLPAFPGAHAVRDALDAGVQVTGCTVHFIDEGVDTGPIIAQRAVDVQPGDTVDTLHGRIKQAERALLVEVLMQLADDGGPG